MAAPPRKRNRSELEEQIQVLSNKRRALDKQVVRVDKEIDDAVGELDALNREEVDARAVEIPWDVFCTGAVSSKRAWEEVRFGADVYHAYKDCDAPDTCWYRGNMDRLDGLILYSLATLDGVQVTLCDLCRLDSRTVDRALERCRHGEEVRVDPDAYEPEIRAVFLNAASVTHAE